MSKKFNFDTIQVHGGQTVDKETKSRAIPIYQTTSYVFDDTKDAAELFALEKFGNIYTRIMNPTTDALEKRIAELEGGVGAVATASGMAAITYSILNIAKAGDEIVAASTLYGGTHTLFTHTLKDFGVKATLVDPEAYEEIEKAINGKTKAIFIETIGNPSINIIDIEKVAKIAHENNIPLIVDNTFATPYLCRPFEHGADIVVHSATKFLGGHGTSVGGLVVDGGKFNWNNGKFKNIVEPNESYNGVSFWEASNEAAYILNLRCTLLRDTGACISPFNSFLLLLGIETLSLRMEKHVANARKIAEFLNSHDNVEWVNYPSLKDNKYNELAKKYLSKGSGAVLTFEVKGGHEAGKTIIESVELFSHLANVGDAKSLIIHPSSTTHGQLKTEEKIEAGVSEGLIRISVGIEDIEDLIDDLGSALDKI